MRTLIAAAGRPADGRALSRRHAWGAVLCLSLVAGLLFVPATSASATGFLVTNVDDAGPGSLRQAILDANASAGADEITFEIDGGGNATISPTSPLPAITEQVSIDATTQPGGASCSASPPVLLIRLEGSGAGAGTTGLTVANGTGTVIKGFIFRRFAGDGVSLSSPASGTTVTCNAIGTTPDGSTDLGNGGAGVAVRSTDLAATAPTTVSGNIIMYSGGAGVLVGAGARSVSIRDNRIDVNLGVGIDLVAAGGSANGDGPTPNGPTGPGTGGNDLRHTPALVSALVSDNVTTVAGSLTVPSSEDGEYVLEFFSVARCDAEPEPGGFGEGARPIGSTTLPPTPGSGPVAFLASGLGNANVGQFVTATATDAFGAGNTSEFSACMQVAPDTSATSADLSVTGTAAPEPASPLGTITYALTVHNDGPDPAEDATLVSELPVGLSLDSMASSGGSCVALVFTVTCGLGTIEPGPANDVHVTIGVVAADFGSDMVLDTHVRVQSSTEDPESDNDELTLTSNVVVSGSRSDLSIHKTGPAEVTEGDAFSYTIDVANAGPDAAGGITVTDDLPAGISFVGASPSIGNCAEELGTVSCDLGALATGGSATIDLQVLADEIAGVDPVVVTNTASVGSDGIDPDPSNDVSEAVSTTVLPGATPDLADLEVSSVLNVPNPVTGGYNLGSTATVTNLGPGDATGVTLTDTLAPGESFVAGGSDPSCTAAAGVVTCGLGHLASGATASVLIVTKTPQVAADATIHDLFAVTAPEEGTPANNTLDVATEVRARRADFVAGYVVPSRFTTWLNDATQWSHGSAVATAADPTVAFVGIPGGGPGGPVTVTESACGAPFACTTLRRSHGRFSSAPLATFGNLIHVNVPGGYGASNPITGYFLDDWSVLGSGWDPFKVSFQPDGSTAGPAVLLSCGGWKGTGPPCVSSIGRSFAWWNPSSFADLKTVVKFTGDGTFGRGR